MDHLLKVRRRLISNTITDNEERARALGRWGAVLGISLAAGPVLGGVLVHTVGWRAIFWVNVPVGIAAIGLTQKFVPESKPSAVLARARNKR